MQKRTGRPVHPLWAHFHRGEKRNRYHYHAYCVYCVACHGMDHVSPTRGVSADLLRHLECCPNCPRNVVESVRELCGLRERVSRARKNENGVEGSKNSFTIVVNTLNQEIPTNDRLEASLGGRTVASEDKASSDTNGHAAMNVTIGQNAFKNGTLSKRAAKRRRTKSDTEPEKDVLTRLLQMAIAANIPLSAFQQRDFQKLLCLSGVLQVNCENISSQVGSNAFLKETATRLARRQLDRMKEGMFNSTIKSGLTLSVTCWRTLNLQHLVAFTLVNSNGDAACVRVEELRQVHHTTNDAHDSMSSMSLRGVAQLLPLASAIGDVLQYLDEQNLWVVGMVVDSAVALSAAKQVCQSVQWRSLLLVPCMSTLLTSLAGCVLTHERYIDAVGQVVEVAAYFSNAQLQASLRLISGDRNGQIPIPTRAHWITFITCVSKTLHFRDAIIALCKNQDESSNPLAPLPLRKLVLEDNCQLWKTLQQLSMLLAPLREAHSFFFPSNHRVGNNDECGICTNTVNEDFSLAHVMYQLGRMNQQYAALAETADPTTLIGNNEDMIVVARRMNKVLDTIWQRYDLPTMVLAYVFDFHLGSERLNNNKVLDWKAVSSYFHRYFHRWFCETTDNQRCATPMSPISSNKITSILSAYQLRQFPFDRDTTSCYKDVSSFYSFVSDSHPEICALCCRVYAVALACADVRRVIRGIGFLPSIAQTIACPKRAELLLHVGFATNLKRTSPSGTTTDATSILHDLIQASRPEELLCSQAEWDLFASDWSEELRQEFAVDELERSRQIDKQQDEEGQIPRLSLDQVFHETLPPLTAILETPRIDDLLKAQTQASVAL